MTDERKIRLDRLERGAAANALLEMRKALIREGRDRAEVEELLVRLLEEREER